MNWYASIIDFHNQVSKAKLKLLYKADIIKTFIKIIRSWTGKAFSINYSHQKSDFLFYLAI